MSEEVGSVRPNPYIFDIENRRKRKPRLAHDLGAGARCNKCGDKCPGFELHFWRKICQNCRCGKDDHEVEDEDEDIGQVVIGKLFERPARTKKEELEYSYGNHLEIVNEETGKAEKLKFDWVPPNVGKNLAARYMSLLPPNKRPVAGSEAAKERKKQLEQQLPLYDMDETKRCDNLPAEELQSFMAYLDRIKTQVAGQGMVQEILPAPAKLMALPLSSHQIPPPPPPKPHSQVPRVGSSTSAGQGDGRFGTGIESPSLQDEHYGRESERFRQETENAPNNQTPISNTHGQLDNKQYSHPYGQLRAPLGQRNSNMQEFMGEMIQDYQNMNLASSEPYGVTPGTSQALRGLGTHHDINRGDPGLASSTQQRQTPAQSSLISSSVPSSRVYSSQPQVGQKQYSVMSKPGDYNIPPVPGYLPTAYSFSGSDSTPEAYSTPGSKAYSAEYDTSGNKNLPGEYGTPGKNLGEYGTPGSKNLPSEYGTPGSKNLPGEFGTPGSKNFPSEYDTPGSKNILPDYGTPGSKNPPGEYGTPGNKNLPGEYGTPGSKNIPVEYGTPGSKNIPTEYGTPGNKNSHEYGTPDKKIYSPENGSQNIPSDYNALGSTGSNLSSYSVPGSSSLSSVQEGNVPHELGSMPQYGKTQQSSLPGSQGTVPNWMAASSGKQAFSPCHVGPVPYRPVLMPDQDGNMRNIHNIIPEQQAYVPGKEATIYGYQTGISEPANVQAMQEAGNFKNKGNIEVPGDANLNQLGKGSLPQFSAMTPGTSAIAAVQAPYGAQFDTMKGDVMVAPGTDVNVLFPGESQVLGGPGGKSEIMPSQNSKFSCQYCSQPMKVGDVAVFCERAGPDKCWHPACFCCFTCHELLADLIYFYQDGKVYCGRHFTQAAHMARCKACDELIFGNSWTRADEFDWHLHHFCCFMCDTPLAGLRYVPDKEGCPYCLPCYMAYLAKMCETCEEKIAPEETRCGHRGYFFHANSQCFSCHTCKVPLLGKKFKMSKNWVFCSSECIQAVAEELHNNPNPKEKV